MRLAFTGSDPLSMLHRTDSCKPQLAHSILHEPGIIEALDGKLLISILAGVTIAQLEEWVLPTTRIVRAMPNTPCKVLQPHIIFADY